jgi:carbamoyl-phosphate synthase large subunit
MNVLLSSVGRRSYLVHYFKDALAGQGQVIATNSQADATGMLAADHAIVIPPAGNPAFIDRLLDVCREYEIRLLFSLHDWEAPFIAGNIQRFKKLGVLPVISELSVLNICLDKYATYNFGLSKGLRVPTTALGQKMALAQLENGNLVYPVIIKPRRGQGSICIEKAFNENELRAACLLIVQKMGRMDSNNLLFKPNEENIIVQEEVCGTEYGLDVVNDFNGDFATCLVKRKLGMRSGETDAAEIVNSHDLAEFGSAIGNHLGHIGLLDVDVIVDQNGPCWLEANARFGGHYPFSHEAGANIPAAMIAWAQGRKAERRWFQVKAGAVFFKDFSFTQQPFGRDDKNP